jgi:lipopolysaccharide export system protein LptC
MGLRVATFSFLILAAGCRPAGPVGERQVIPELTMDGVEFQIDRGGVTTATGQAERLTYRRDTTDVAAVDLSMDLTTPTGQIRFTAPAGSGHLLDQRYRVTGGIRATRGSDVATTPSATARPGPDGNLAIHGDQPVQIEGTGYRLNGTGFDVQPGTGDFVVRGQPHLVTGLGARP